MSSTVTQVSRVRALYKAILRLHRGLPLQMRALGDQYVKDEFRRHKDVPVPEAQIFMNEWTVSQLKYSQTCIKRSPFTFGTKWPYKTGDLLKEVQFIWNFLWQDKKNVTFLIQVTA